MIFKGSGLSQIFISKYQVFTKKSHVSRALSVVLLSLSNSGLSQSAMKRKSLKGVYDTQEKSRMC